MMTAPLASSAELILASMPSPPPPSAMQRQPAAYPALSSPPAFLAADRPPILVLHSSIPAEQARVGNKAWHLARMARAGLPVPEGFCIASDALANTARGAALPAALVQEILRQYRQLGAPLVAVRSSASDEDGEEQSAAGRYTSILNVRGEAALLAAVQACRDASAMPRARLGQPNDGAPTLAILVQKQVSADTAGVLFTADPLSGARGQLVVNATPGLGEPLASGRVTGDTFRLSLHGDLLQQTVHRKETMLTEHGEQPVPCGRRQRPALTAPQLRQLATLAAQVERHFFSQPAADTRIGGYPALDIEFAFADGRPLLLQARPVPTLTPPTPKATNAYVANERQRLDDYSHALRARRLVTGADIVWSSGNIRELLPTPTRFSFAVFCHLFAGANGAIVAGRRRLGYPLAPAAGEELFVLIGGQPYFNLEVDAGTFDIGHPLPVAQLLAEVASEPGLANYPELGLYPRILASTPGGSDAATAFRSHMLHHAHLQKRRFATLLRYLDRAHDNARTAARGVPRTVPALQQEIARSLARLRQLAVRFVIAARIGFFFADLLRRHLTTVAPDTRTAERRYARLLGGLNGSRITEQSLDLEKVCHGTLSHEAFLARHGHMAGNELELHLPRLAECPQRLAHLIAELRASGRSPARDFARQQTTRRRTENALARLLADRPADQRALFDELEAAQHYLPLRESIKYHLAAEYARLRYALLALNDALQLPPGALFQLVPDEIATLDAPVSAAILATIAQRQAEHDDARALARETPMPEVIFASRLGDIGAPSSNGASDRTTTRTTTRAAHRGLAPEPPEPARLDATPIAPGRSEGIVRLVRLDEDALEANLTECFHALSGNEIIVAPSANLGLGPLFRVAAGVVVEVGGVLAHSACQAREAGIPALVLRGATRMLCDGDRVRLDAERGEIIVLARAASPRENLR